MKLSKNKRLRHIVLWVLRVFNPGTIRVKHPFTGGKLVLDAYMHKGYWFRGKDVEKDTMDLFRLLIEPGSTVIEVGGHIGFMTQYFSSLTGEGGKVYVFEPADNNLVFLRKNIEISKFKNIILIEKAVSDAAGIATFYIENITGQNNSLVNDHIGPNSHKNIKDERKKVVVEIETISLDDFILKEEIHKTGFIKIDIESAELLALKGMINILREHKPRIMFEISRDQKEIFSILKSYEYLIFDVEKNKLESINYGNVFCIHVSDQEGLKRMQ
ncbi:FkbM family methyltransferase [Panacibacter ginsenosidivorans]|uniref:FkbM family methyltransferase n=1 Tax=Panacibacter ginsenosidivorans TaxID=1813871 RepID=A0A5B8VFI2_9BACT|nr:FkbM family methyltransferase [Panacibacter ginsenosidivorans]QEC69108.1 FkbM family methyltransferase [Panacibacter ginsenosidivorans]